MNENKLKDYIEKFFSISKIAEFENTSKTNVRYWLGKYGLKTKRAENIKSDVKQCPKCLEIKSMTEFYNRRNKEGNSSYCKPCTVSQTIERQRIFKEQCIDYKGGNCEICGYNQYNGALEFHHLDPTKKEFTIANFRLTTFNDKVKLELDKCILVCANCHREVHGGLHSNYNL